ncbi:hypothetical protein AVEN_211362-1, partial [Araneus ventricosus]
YGYPIYCCASDTVLQRLERVHLSAARIITGLRNSCPKDIVIDEANLEPLSLGRIPNLVKYYNKLYSLDSRDRTSAYLKDWCNNQRLKRNSPFSQVMSCNLITNTVEQRHLTQRIDPSVGLPDVFFHTNLPVQVNKQIDNPTYLRQLALEIINDIPDSNFSLQQACHKFVMTRVQACSKLTKASKSPWNELAASLPQAYRANSLQNIAKTEYEHNPG